MPSNSLLFREKEKRKIQIRDFISRSFNWAGQPMPTGEEVRETISSLPDVDLPLSSITAPDPLTLHYTETVQSFVPIGKIIYKRFKCNTYESKVFLVYLSCIINNSKNYINIKLAQMNISLQLFPIIIYEFMTNYNIITL